MAAAYATAAPAANQGLAGAHCGGGCGGGVCGGGDGGGGGCRRPPMTDVVRVTSYLGRFWWVDLL